jgi:hypothetical protein
MKLSSENKAMLSSSHHNEESSRPTWDIVSLRQNMDTSLIERIKNKTGILRCSAWVHLRNINYTARVHNINRNYQVVIGIWRQDKGFKAHLKRLSHIFCFHKFLKIVNPSIPGSERVSCGCEWESYLGPYRWEVHSLANVPTAPLLTAQSPLLTRSITPVLGSVSISSSSVCTCNDPNARWRRRKKTSIATQSSCL